MAANEDLLDELACARLMLRTNACSDRHDIDTFLSLLADDAVLYRAGQPFEGHAAIRGMLEGRPRSRVTRHLMGTPVVELTGPDEARGWAPFVIYDAIDQGDGEPLPLSLPAIVGDYEQHYRRTNGEWKIVRFEISPVFRPTES